MQGKEKYLFKARLADQIDRYDDMVKFMNQFAIVKFYLCFCLSTRYI